MSMVHRAAVPVSADLRRWIAGIEVASAEPAGEHKLAHVPDGAAVLVFRMSAGRRADLLVAGPRTRASYRMGGPVPLYVKVRIQPGRAGPLLGAPLNELTDHVVPLSQLWGKAADRLTAELARFGPRSPAGLIRRHVETAVRDRLSTCSHHDQGRTDLLCDAIEALAPTTTGQQPASLSALARRTAVSERHLRNLFAAGVGVAPKRLACITRVRYVLAHAPQRPWAQLTADCGYYDQSHLGAEFRRLMGTSPQAFLTGRLPTPEPC